MKFRFKSTGLPAATIITKRRAANLFAGRPLDTPVLDAGKIQPLCAKLRPRCKGKQRERMSYYSALMAILRHKEKLARLAAGNVIMNRAAEERRVRTP